MFEQIFYWFPKHVFNNVCILYVYFKTVFINIYYNMLQCQKHSAKLKIILIGGQIFSPSLVYLPAVPFSEKYIFSSTEKSELI